MSSAPTLLLAHDDPDVARLLQQGLADRGWHVVLAADSVATVDAARRERPAVVVVGTWLPGGGAATVRRLRLVVDTTAIPVVGVVANAAEREALLLAGAQACAVGPPDLDALAALVAEHAARPLRVVEAPADALRRPARLRAVEEAGLRDGETDEMLDGLTELAASLLDVPIALATLVDHDRQRFAGQVGLTARWAAELQTPLSYSFCQWVVAADEPLAVSDARFHPALCANLAVQELGVVAYAGLPMEAASGEAIGSFCALDARPRAWLEEELDVLGELSAIAEGYIAGRVPVPAIVGGAERRARAQKVVEGIRAATRVLRRRHPALDDTRRAGLLALVDRQAEQLARLLDAPS